MFNFLKKILFIFVFFFNSFSANASPSKAETINYIKKYLSHKNTTYQFNDCAISIRNKHQNILTSLNLKELDPYEVRNIRHEGVDFVQVNCRENNKCVSIFIQGNKRKSAGTGFWLNSLKGDRVAKAFSHLSTLCGGQKELF